MLTKFCFGQNSTIIKGEISIIDTVCNPQYYEYNYLVLLVVDSSDLCENFIVARMDSIPCDYWKVNKYKLNKRVIKRSEASLKMKELLKDVPSVYRNKLKEHSDVIYSIKLEE